MSDLVQFLVALSVIGVGVSLLGLASFVACYGAGLGWRLAMYDADRQEGNPEWDRMVSRPEDHDEGGG